MIARDRELLARVSQVNQQLGEVTVELMARQDGGELPAVELRAVAEALAAMAAELATRADEIDEPAEVESAATEGATLARAILDARL